MYRLYLFLMNRLGIFFICFFTIGHFVSAQKNAASKLDSLETKIHKADNEFQTAYLRIEIARAASLVDSVKAYENALKALSFFENTKDSLGLAKANAALGFVHFDYNSMLQAEKQYTKARKILDLLIQQDSTKQLIDIWAETILNLAASIGNQGRYDEELKYYTELAPVVKKFENHKVLGIINTNIAISSYNNGDLKKAYSYFKNNNLNYNKTTAYSQFAADRLIFASCLMQMDSLETAKRMMAQAKQILENIPDSTRWQLYYQQLGELYVTTGDYNKALTAYDRSIEIIKKRKSYGALAQQYLQYVKLYKKLEDSQKEKEYMLKFYETSKNHNLPDVVYAMQELAKYEYRAKNYKTGLGYAINFFEINDSIERETIIKETARLEQLYQKEKKEREIAELTTLHNSTELNLERKKSQNYLLYFLVGTLIFITLAGYLTYNNRQKRNLLAHKAQEQEIQGLKVRKERELFGVMMEGVEKERKRLAADLHDGLAGRLSGISIKLSKLAQDKQSEQLSEEFAEILDNIDDSLQELRGVARNLMPETLLKYGLKSALEDFCSTIRDKDTKIVLQFYGNDEVEKSKKLTLYRIMQELINNAIRHANATEILVQFINEKGKIDITVEDDGIGLTTDLNSKNEGMGLSNLRNRVDFLQGTIEINSVLNEGTSVNIQIEQI